MGMRWAWRLGAAGTLVTAVGCAAVLGLEPADQGTGGGGTTAGTGGAEAVASSSSGAGGTSSTATSSASGTSSSSASSTSSAASSSSGGTATSSSSGSSSSGTVGDACAIPGGPAPTLDSNALMCPADLCAIGLGGCMFLFSDMGPMTTIGLAPNEACTAGTLTPLDSASKYYGAGVGFNLGPAVTGGTPAPVQLAGSGITVKLSKLPAGGARLQVVVQGVTYCAPILTNPATISWSEFNSLCYHVPPDGTYLAGPPDTPFVTLNILSDLQPVSFDFCVEQLTVTTM